MDFGSIKKEYFQKTKFLVFCQSKFSQKQYHSSKPSARNWQRRRRQRKKKWREKEPHTPTEIYGKECQMCYKLLLRMFHVETVLIWMRVFVSLSFKLFRYNQNKKAGKIKWIVQSPILMACFVIFPLVFFHTFSFFGVLAWQFGLCRPVQTKVFFLFADMKMLVFLLFDGRYFISCRRIVQLYVWYILYMGDDNVYVLHQHTMNGSAIYVI